MRAEGSEIGVGKPVSVGLQFSGKMLDVWAWEVGGGRGSEAGVRTLRLDVDVETAQPVSCIFFCTGSNRAQVLVSKEKL